MDYNQKIEVLNSIPVTAHQEQTEWLRIGHICKAAGITPQDFDLWCSHGAKYSDDVVTRYSSFQPKETEQEATIALIGEAKKHGYKPRYTQSKYTPSSTAPLISIPPFYLEKAIADSMDILHLLNHEYITFAEAIQSPHRIKTTNVNGSFLENFLNSNGAYIMLNQTDGRGVKKENIINFDWCILQSDEQELGQQWGVIQKLGLPIMAVIHSGNKSLHCYTHIGATNAEQYKERVKAIHSFCSTHGLKVDSACKNENRWCRFPIAKRGEKYQYPIAVYPRFATYEEWENKVKSELEKPQVIDVFDRVLKNGVTKTVAINLVKVLQIVKSMGYRVVKDGNEMAKIVKVEDHIIYETDMENVKILIGGYIKNNFPSDYDFYLKHRGDLNNQLYLSFDKITPLLHWDTREKVYFYFKNGVLQVTQSGKKLIKYDDIDGYIWDRNIIKNDLAIGGQDGVFSHFISLISNNNPQRIKVLRSAIGYLLNRYKSKILTKAVVLTDQSLGSSEGRTGKGIIVSAIEKMRTVYAPDMSNRANNQFVFSGVTKGTNVLHLQDVSKTFDFRSIFNAVASDIEVQEKGKDRFKIQFEIAPKIVISTNFFIKGNSSSYKGRKAVYELFNFFNAEKTPFEYFHHELFKDWDFQEWQKFYNYMIGCVQIFLKDGLIEFQTENIIEKMIVAECGKTFYDFITEWQATHKWYEDPILTKGFFEEYKEDVQQGDRMTAKGLLQRVKKWCSIKGFVFEKMKTRNTRGFIIRKPNQTTIEPQLTNAVQDDTEYIDVPF